MTRDDARQVKAFMLSALSQPLGGGDSTPSRSRTIRSASGGVIDSLGFVQLLVASGPSTGSAPISPMFRRSC